MVRTSIPITASSGTEFTLSPPLMVPTFSVGAPSNGSGATSNWKLLSWSTARAALITALTPICGIDPCAVTPRVRARNQSAPLCPMTGRFPVGSPTTIPPARPSAAGAFAAGDDAGTSGRELVRRHAVTCIDEQVADPLRAGPLRAVGIDGIDLDQLARQLHGVHGFLLGPSGRPVGGPDPK